MSTTPLSKASTHGRCPECGSDELVRDYAVAEIVCRQCGFVVIDQLTDKGPEWRAFNAEQRRKRARVGAPLTYAIHDKGLSTMIDWRNKDTYGKSLPAGQRAQVYRLRKWQRRARVSDATERNLAAALTELSKISATLNLPRSILETASVIYRRALSEKLVRGRSINGVAAASLYMACRQCGVTRTLDEIAKAEGLTSKVVGRAYRYMVRKLREYVPPSSSTHYISRYVNQLELDGGTETIALRLLRNIKEQGLTNGRGPQGIGASITYMASILTSQRRTQREIAAVADITEVTIRNRYKEILERVNVTVKL
jgi:transcription initiation factor TFIIB